MPVASSSERKRRRVAAQLLGPGALLFLLLAAHATRTSLLEIRPESAGSTFRLVCDGAFKFSQAKNPDPTRLILDLPDVSNGLKQDSVRFESELVRSVRVDPIAGSAAAGSRVVFELKRPVSVSLVQRERELQVNLSAAGPADPPGDPAPPGAGPLGTNLGAGIAGIATSVRPPGPVLATTSDYVIGKEDLLELGVFQQPDLTRTVRVSGDGTISLPLLGVIPVDGLTTQQAAAKLRDMLAERYLTDPQVWVFVKEAKSKKISVVGAVEKPGTIEMLGSRTLLEAISEAGGLTQQAGGDLYVLRPDPSGAATRIDVDLDDLMIRGNPELNIPILPGDVINVPIDRILHVYVDGAVRKPGEVEYKASRPLNLIQAIAAAGGLSERASQKGILVIRNIPGAAQERLKIDLKAVRKGQQENILLQSGDSIYVAETFF